MLTLPLMQKMWPNGNQHIPGLLEGIAAAAPTVFPRFGMTTPLVVAHAMAQFSEECGAGLEMIENDNFTAAQLVALWPRHFTGSMADRYAHNPKMICDVAYGGRMGNDPPPSDDGWTYHGQGISQLTGKDNYEALTRLIGVDVVTNPGALIAPTTALLCGVADFVAICGCLPYAEKDDVVGVTQKLNGGQNGIAVRRQWLAKWKAEIPTMQAAAAAPAAPSTIQPSPAPAPTSVAPVPAQIPDQVRAELTELLGKIQRLLTGGQA